MFLRFPLASSVAFFDLVSRVAFDIEYLDYETLPVFAVR